MEIVSNLTITFLEEQGYVQRVKKFDRDLREYMTNDLKSDQKTNIDFEGRTHFIPSESNMCNRKKLQMIGYSILSHVYNISGAISDVPTKQSYEQLKTANGDNMKFIGLKVKYEPVNPDSELEELIASEKPE
jgi:hypothetical protein